MTAEELVLRAESAAANAYAPYSNYFVGAFVLAKDGRLFDGCNVESAAYPLGVCAERTAIAKAARILWVDIVTPYGPSWCVGRRRQQLQAFLET